MDIDPQHFRAVLGHYPAGVAVITAVDDGEPVGMAVNSFTSASLDPPLVLFLPDRSSTTWPRVRRAGAFCVNILGWQQEDVCRSFAARGGDKFRGLAWRPTESGSPVLEGAIAWIDCEVAAVHEAGDHYLVLGAVRGLDVVDASAPLVFFRGGYGRFAAGSLVVRDPALVSHLRVVELARRELEAAAKDLGVECIASAEVEGQMVLLASAGESPAAAPPMWVGQRIPLMAPLGTVYLAWADEPAVQRWVTRAWPDDEVRHAAARRTLDDVRQAGYSVSVGQAWRFDADAQLGVAVDPTDPRPAADLGRAIRSLPPDFESPRRERAPERSFGAVSVPVFGPSGELALVLSAVVLPGATAADFAAQAGRLQVAAEDVQAGIRAVVGT